MKPGTQTDRAAQLVVTALGLGTLPVAPGTWGTLGAAAVHAAVAVLFGTAGHPHVLPLLAALFTAACVAYGPWAERFYARKDPSPFVIDEVAGYLLAVSFFPREPQLRVGLLVFVLFRLFDVLKLPPAWRSQELPGGVGIVADDLIAGLQAALVAGVVMLGVFPGGG